MGPCSEGLLGWRPEAKLKRPLTWLREGGKQRRQMRSWREIRAAEDRGRCEDRTEDGVRTAG